MGKPILQCRPDVVTEKKTEVKCDDEKDTHKRREDVGKEQSGQRKRLKGPGEGGGRTE